MLLATQNNASLICGYWRDELSPPAPPEQMCKHPPASLWHCQYCHFQGEAATAVLVYQKSRVAAAEWSCRNPSWPGQGGGWGGCGGVKNSPPSSDLKWYVQIFLALVVFLESRAHIAHISSFKKPCSRKLSNMAFRLSSWLGSHLGFLFLWPDSYIWSDLLSV